MKKHLLIILIVLFAGLLRIVSLDTYPIGINADEAAIGYNAWSLIQTGMDEHKVSWPLVFRSFDDYKPPMYFYLVLPFVKVLGLNIWSVRLPSAILGTLSVWLIYLFVKKISSDRSETLASLSALLLAISPWHLQFSRGGWEVNVSTFFILASLLFFLESLTVVKNLIYFAIFSVLALYTYHSARLVLPLLVFSVISLRWQDFLALFGKKNLKVTLISLFFGFLLVTPLIMQMTSKEGQSRFAGVSVFSDEGPLWQALEMRREHQADNLYVKTIHNRYQSYGLRVVKNYLSHFSPRFLFVVGDEIARSKVPGIGQSLIILFPFFFIGLFNLLKLDNFGKRLVGLWFIIAPIAAASTFQAPHALRAENIVIPLVITIALGVNSFIEFVKKLNIKLISYSVFCLLTLVTIYDFSFYLHQYYVHYPKELPYAWQYGFDQIATYTQKHYAEYDRIVITDRYDQPYIIMAFYLHYPPQTLQNELVMTPRDKFGFSTVRKMGKYEFRVVDWDKDKILKNTLVISADELVDDKKVIDTIKDPDGKIMYKILSTK